MLLLYALYPFIVVAIMCGMLRINPAITLLAEIALYYWLRARAMKKVRAYVQRWTCQEHNVYGCRECFRNAR